MPANKDQHFVPQFLIRQFSSDPRRESKRKWVNLYLLQGKQLISRASIAGQCQKPYFYGKNKAIEEALGKLEARIKYLLSNLNPETINHLSEDDLLEIRLFIYIQHLRTLEAANRLDNLLGEFTKFSLEKNPKLSDINLDQFSIHHENPQLIAVENAIMATSFLEDLKICFLRNTEGTDFVLSDHPANSCNQFGEHHPWLGPRYSTASAIGSKGVQLFMPLAPDLCAAIYDPSTYNYGDNRIIDITPEDAWKINKLQASNANFCLFIKTDTPDLKSLKRLSVLNKKAEKYRQKVNVLKSFVVDEPNGRKSQLAGFNIPDIRLGIKFTFARIVNDIDYTGYNLGAFPPRSFQKIEYARKFLNYFGSKSPKAPDV